MSPPLWQEVPADFTEATGWPRVAQCFVLTSSRSRTEWPLHMTQLSSSTCVGTAISDSAGWLNFLEHMPVSVGDILCFEIVDERTLVASIAYHRGRPPQIAVEKPQEVNVNAPHFRKKLRASHTRPHKSARLVTPHLLTVVNPMLTSSTTVAFELTLYGLCLLKQIGSGIDVLCSVVAGHSHLVLALRWGSEVRRQLAHTVWSCPRTRREERHVRHCETNFLLLRHGLVGFHRNERPQDRGYTSIYTGHRLQVRSEEGMSVICL